MANAKNISTIKTIILVLFFIALTYTYINYSDNLTTEGIRSFVESYGAAAPIAYGILYIGTLILLFPATIASILAGVIFGKLLGSIIVVVSATIAAGLAFYITRYFGEEITSYLEKGIISDLIKNINKQFSKEGVKTWFILRCLFLPYIPLSYAGGLVKKARFRDFIIGTFITNAIFSPVFVYFGDQATQGPKALILPAALIILVLLVPRIVKKFR